MAELWASDNRVNLHRATGTLLSTNELRWYLAKASGAAWRRKDGCDAKDPPPLPCPFRVSFCRASLRHVPGQSNRPVGPVVDTCCMYVYTYIHGI
jgi:hypothetical protein